ncbi:hypothetical protein OG394_01630 [Kribbella sp. NBC_01245]|uniref:type IV toxin-antitoxin system AbiEi family antitoxin n=1 Tax=Kribbella sp. NBC_01245 TaxID=2903578 RepID=UPI002E2A7572|nr:type IV toxin-antitoxin system AbiEi family antitoxin [Kribbella sp. NBC_01245]
MLFDDLRYFDGAPFTRAQAERGGWDHAKLRRHLANGLIRQVLKTVYVDALVPDSLELRAAALCLVTPLDAVICRRTAAWLFGIDTFALQERDGPLAIDTLRPGRHRAIRRSKVTGHSQTVLPGDVMIHRGLRVTTPAATAVHLARHLRRPYALSALDAMLHAGLLDHGQLCAAIGRYPKHPGIAQARELALFADPLTESPGESWLRLRLLDAGFPRPQAQVRVLTPRGERRIDLGYPDIEYHGRRIGLEYDSDQWHSGRRASFRDETRRLDLDDVGWLILPVRRGDVWGRRVDLEYVVGEMLGIEPRLPRRW